jgi:hypothetical protein
MARKSTPASAPSSPQHVAVRVVVNPSDKAAAYYANQHGGAAIVTVRETEPAQYLSVVASRVPKNIDIRANEDVDVERLEEQIALLDAIIDQRRNKLNIAFQVPCLLDNLRRLNSEGKPCVHSHLRLRCSAFGGDRRWLLNSR